MNKTIILKIIAIAALLFLMAWVMACIPDFLRTSQQPQATDSQPAAAGSLEQFNQNIRDLVNKVLPSVVNIRVGILEENILGQTQLQEGVGSGVIYDEQGYIITNSHVAADAQQLIVTLNDGTQVEAELVGASRDTDIAVIKIDSNGLKPANFASIEDQHVGDLVIAAGSPFGIQQTVTMGIISGKGRTLPVSSDQLPIVDAVQTDAAINPGNSGGPLININGEVIGINTMGISASGTSSGVGFAIPSDTATNIADQIIQYGRARIPFIGIEITANNTEIPGVAVGNIVENSPASKAGIRTGDIIVEFDQKSITTPFDLLSQLLRKDCGQEVELKIYRDGDYLSIMLELEECPTPRD
ncbi:MAG: trypsin-like peptidase domain-containing protein [Actinomycetia bacterium]|nr:trypsin-like peptidase domain-containing protein [Actinomycetes bacterium]